MKQLETHALPGDVHAWLLAEEFNLRAKFKVVRSRHCDHALKKEGHITSAQMNINAI